jgi:hypothetical protein
LLAAAGIVLLILLAFRGYLFYNRIRWPWLIPILIATAAFALDYFVKTDREKVKTVIAKIVKAAEQEDPNAIELLIADNYRDSFHKSKKYLINRCIIRLAEPVIKKNIARILSVNIDSAGASVVFTVRVLFDPQSYIYQDFKKELFVKVEANLEKQQGLWLFTRIEITQIDLMPADWRSIQ